MNTPRTPLRTPPRILTGVAAFLGAGALLTACSVGATDAGNETGNDTVTQTSASYADVEINELAAQVLADNEKTTILYESDWDESGAVDIDLNDESGTVDITEAGTYLLSGTLDGQVIVNAPEDATVALILEGVNISSTNGPGIYVQSADDVALVLAEGSTNVVTDKGSTETEDENAGIASEADLTIAGTGALEVTGTVEDGISSDDDLAITGGTITVSAVDDGLRGKDSFAIIGGEVIVAAGGDGIKSSNDEDATRGFVNLQGGSVTVTSEGDAISAETDVVLTGSTVDVVSGGGIDQQLADDVSAKGIKGSVIVVIAGGTLAVDAADDAIHSNGEVHVVDGDATLATADDGIHADQLLAISGGNVTVTDSYEGLEASVIEISGDDVTITSSDDGINASSGSGSTSMDPMAAEDGVLLTMSGGTVRIDAEGDGFDSNGTALISGGTLMINGPLMGGNGSLDSASGIEITGGTLVAVGSAGMAETPSANSSQGWVATTASGSAGSAIELLDSSGASLFTWEASKAFETVIISTPDVKDGGSYVVSVDGTNTDVVAGTAIAGGMGGPAGGGPAGGPADGGPMEDGSFGGR